MHAVCVTVWVLPEHVAPFIDATLENARATRGEPGNLRFDVCQAEDDPSRFLLFEVYRSPEDFQAHQRTTHYLQWREAVAAWMAKPRQGLRHRVLLMD